MSLYEQLGLSRGADAAEIKKGYRKMSLLHHPDKGGDPEKFKEIQHAYEVLSDEQRKTHYDMTGSDEEQPLNQGPGMPGMPGMPFPFDMSNLFGNMFGQKPKVQKGPPKVHDIPLSLSDFYVGREIKLQFDRQQFCTTCKGEGTTRYDTCGGCGGSGARQTIMSMGGGVQAMMRGPCPECSGQGKRPAGACDDCKGLKFKSQERVLFAKIVPGMKPGDMLVFPGECSDSHGYATAGDVQIRLQDADPDGRFYRLTGDTLAIRVRIGLLQSLVGFTEVVKGHPGFPDLNLTLAAGVQNGETIIMDGKGLPRKDGGHGALHILVTVVASDAEKEILKQNAPILSTWLAQSLQDPMQASSQGSAP